MDTSENAIDNLIKQLNDTLVKKKLFQEEIKRIVAARLKLHNDEEAVKNKILQNDNNRVKLLKLITNIQLEDEQTDVNTLIIHIFNKINILTIQFQAELANVSLVVEAEHNKKNSNVKSPPKLNKRIRTENMVPDTIYKLVDNDIQLVETVNIENKVEIENMVKKN